MTNTPSMLFCFAASLLLLHGCQDASPTTTAIPNGQNATSCKWKWQANLIMQYLNSSDEATMCGGSLIAPKYVLTAAHCVKLTSKIRMDGEDGEGRDYQIVKSMLHPDVVRSRTQDWVKNDLALLELAEEVPSSDCVAQVRVPTNPIEVGKTCYVTGYNGLGSKGLRPTTLQEAQVDILSHDECLRRLCGNPKLCEGHVYEEDMVCVVGRNRNGLCQQYYEGTGGALVCEDQGHWTLHGVASKIGPVCASGHEHMPYYEYQPFIYSRVFPKMDWIKAANTTGMSAAV
jgi:secreted trypsin-like serine protease